MIHGTIGGLLLRMTQTDIRNLEGKREVEAEMTKRGAIGIIQRKGKW